MCGSLCQCVALNIYVFGCAAEWKVSRLVRLRIDDGCCWKEGWHWPWASVHTDVYNNATATTTATTVIDLARSRCRCHNNLSTIYIYYLHIEKKHIHSPYPNEHKHRDHTIQLHLFFLYYFELDLLRLLSIVIIGRLTVYISICNSTSLDIRTKDHPVLCNSLMCFARNCAKNDDDGSMENVRRNGIARVLETMKCITHIPARARA